jgi:hypothetical protein
VDESTLKASPKAINVKGGGDPYPYSGLVPDDNVLSTLDATTFSGTAVPTGAKKFPDAAIANDVANVSPTGTQPSVLYLKRGDAVEPKSAARPNGVYTVGNFPDLSAITASDAANAAKLAGLGFTAKPGTAWATGEFVTIATYKFHWTGTAWAAGAA